MLDHVSLTVSDLPGAEPFYDAVMAALGYPKVHASADWLGYGQRCDADRPDLSYLSVRAGAPPDAAHGRHLCFKAPSRAAVDAFWAAGLAAGGSDDDAPACARATTPTTTPPSWSTRPATASKRRAIAGLDSAPAHAQIRRRRALRPRPPLTGCAGACLWRHAGGLRQRRLQGAPRPRRPKEQDARGDASMTVAFTFPGQGSQAVGMGKALAEAFPPARAVFDEVDAALGQKLSALMFEGPEDELTLTANAQPALMAVSLAVVARAGGGSRPRSRARRRLRRRPFARRIFGAVRRRRLHPRRHGAPAAHPRRRDAEGRAGRRRAPWRRCSGSTSSRPPRPPRPRPRRARSARPPTTMAAGRSSSPATKAAVERAFEIAKAKGARRAMLLPVSAPFHCALMQPAADAMAEALADSRRSRRRSCRWSPMSTAAPITDPERSARRWSAQVTGTVRWREMRRLHGGAGRDAFSRSAPARC